MNTLKSLTTIAARFLIVCGLCAISFMAGATFNTKLDVSFRVAQGAQAAEENYNIKLSHLADKLPDSDIPPRKPMVQK